MGKRSINSTGQWRPALSLYAVLLQPICESGKFLPERSSNGNWVINQWQDNTTSILCTRFRRPVGSLSRGDLARTRGAGTREQRLLLRRDAVLEFLRRPVVRGRSSRVRAARRRRQHRSRIGGTCRSTSRYRLGCAGGSGGSGDEGLRCGGRRVCQREDVLQSRGRARCHLMSRYSLSCSAHGCAHCALRRRGAYRRSYGLERRRRRNRTAGAGR